MEMCRRCLATKDIVKLKSKKKEISLCQKCFDKNESGNKLIEGHGYEIITPN